MLMHACHMSHPLPFAQNIQRHSKPVVSAAMSSVPVDLIHLDQQLPSEVDTTLVSTQVPKTVTTDVFERRPGVNTLREWGQCILPEGKHRGKTFEEAFSPDQNYCAPAQESTCSVSLAQEFPEIWSCSNTDGLPWHVSRLREMGDPITLETERWGIPSLWRRSIKQ